MTRTEYLAATHEPGSAHRTYYAQFVTAGIKARVFNRIGLERLKASTDPHFNDIGLTTWDRLANVVPVDVARLMREQGDYSTLGGMVCVLKEAARQIVEASAD